MLSALRFAALLLLLTVCGSIQAADSLSDAKLESLKSATVYVLVDAGAESGSGSGFVVRREGKTAWAITNHHVIAIHGRQSARIEVVLNSGSATEQTCPAKVVCTDPAADLAVLSFESDRLPQPLSITGGTKLKETLPLVVLGFPFGEMLATSGKHPAITIGNGTISSLRRNDVGALVAIQVDGAINPGNSGGPVTTQDGTVIGVSVATVRGAQIGIVIPGQVVLDLLQGRPVEFVANQIASRKGEVKLDCTVTFVDPFTKITSASLLLIQESLVTTMPQADPRTGEAPKISTAAREFPLIIKDGLGTCKAGFSGPRDSGSVTYIAQVRTSSGGTTRYSGLQRFALDFSGEAGNKTPPTGNNAEYPKPADAVTAPADPGASTVGVPTETTVSETPLPKPVSDVAVAGNGRYLVIAMQDFNGLTIYDADQRKISSTIRLPTNDFLFAAGGDSVVVFAKDAGVFTTFDVATGTKRKSKQSPYSGTVVRITMGRARGDVALLRVAQGTEALDRCESSLLNLESMTPIPFSTVTGGANGLSTHNLSFRDFVHQRADSTLSMITEWASSHSPTGLVLFKINGTRLSIAYNHDSAGALMVGDDGRIYSSTGLVFDRDLAKKGTLTGQRLFPGIGGVLYLGMDAKGNFNVYACGQTTPLVRLGTFPDLPLEQDNAQNSRLGQWTTDTFGFDKQIVFDPLHGRLIIIPLSLDKIIQRPFDLKTVMESSGLDYLLVMSRPALTAIRGKAWSYQVQALSKAGNVAYSLESGPDGMVITPAGKVTWTPRGTAPKESVIILVKDKGGEQCYHTFDLFLVDTK